MCACAQVTTSGLRNQVGRIQGQVKEIQEVVRMYSSTTGPRRVRRQKMETITSEVVDTNVRTRCQGSQRGRLMLARRPARRAMTASLMLPGTGIAQPPSGGLRSR
jgi:hypothetical protein